MSRYIDADALIESIKNTADLGGWIGETLYQIKQVAIKYIDSTPSIDIEPKRGEWILLEPRYPIEQKVYWNKEQALADTKGNGAIEKRKCSCCGFTKNFMGHMKDEKFKLWNYCPNCGTSMREREGE